ncbi:MAG: sulfite exporter TauE/SafE family protein [Vicinamibacterales bacterium]
MVDPAIAVDVTLVLAALVAGAGAIAGALGALLGLGGGVFLVPFLVIGLHLPMRLAVGVSLTTVIATSSAVSAGTAGRQLINLKLGLLLEVATAAGGLLGGVTAVALSPRTLAWLFSLVTGGIAVVTLARLHRRNILEPSVDPGRWGGRFHDEDTGETVTYRVRRLPLALTGSFLAGNLSTLLGIGGGVIKVPMLNAWCGVPMRVAAATSAFMIGVTATSGAIVYYGQGAILPGLAAAAVLGVQVGSWFGLRFGGRSRVRELKLLLAIVLVVVSVLMVWRVG